MEAFQVKHLARESKSTIFTNKGFTSYRQSSQKGPLTALENSWKASSAVR